MSHVQATCQFIAKEYGVQPNKSWGDLPAGALRSWWDQNNCNAFIPAEAAQPTPALALGTCAYIGNWAAAARPDLLRKLDRLCVAFWSLDAQGQITGRVPAFEESVRGLARQTLVSLGGWGNCATFSAVFGSAALRAAAVANLGAAITAAGFQGLDLDWEFPSAPADPASMVAFLRAFKTAFPGLVVTIAGSSQPASFYAAVAADLAAAVDAVHVMTYDYVGSWNPTMQYNSTVAEAQVTLTSYELLGFPTAKLWLGSAWYGRECSVASTANNGIGSKLLSTTDMSFADIATQRLGQQGWLRVWDANEATPALVNAAGGKVITYEDANAVQSKRAWATKQGLGGIFCWAWGQDDSVGTLAHTLLGI